MVECKPLYILVRTNIIVLLDLNDWNPYKYIGKAPLVAPDTSVTRITILGRERDAVLIMVREELLALSLACFPLDDPYIYY